MKTPPVRSATHEALRRERRWIQELIDETDTLNATERYQAWLAVTANLWHYSPLNCCLILGQSRRGVMGVASASEWRRRGRTLKGGRGAHRHPRPDRHALLAAIHGRAPKRRTASAPGSGPAPSQGVHHA